MKTENERSVRTGSVDGGSCYTLCLFQSYNTHENGQSNSLAYVRVKSNGVPMNSQEVRSRDGEIGACLKALDQLFGVIEPDTVREQYELCTEQRGSVVLTCARVTVRRADTKREGVCVDKDATMAVLQAYLNAINALGISSTQDDFTLPFSAWSTP